MDIKFEKVLSVFLYILLAVIFAFSAALVMPVYRKYVAEWDNVAELREQLERSRAECIALNQEVHDLEHYPSAAEKVAREKFKLCREGEEIFIYSR